MQGALSEDHQDVRGEEITQSVRVLLEIGKGVRDRMHLVLASFVLDQ